MELGLGDQICFQATPVPCASPTERGIELLGEGRLCVWLDIAGRATQVSGGSHTLDTGHVHRKCPYCTVLTEDLRVTGSQGCGPRNFIFRQS